MKRLATSVFCGFAIAALSVATALAAPPNINGTWVVQQTGANGTSTGTITVTQSGMGFVGMNAKTGNGFTGTFVDDTKINGKWHGPGGAGWLTIYVSPNGHSFNGTWGYNGRAANGSFVGNKVLPPSPITAAGKWNLIGAGNAGGFIGPMSCKESGVTVVCHVGAVIVINGKFRTKDKVRATWVGPNGSGWFSFWFNGDNNSFNAVWGNGADSTPAVGRVVGQRVLQ
ncbi:MAG: hypothetical protein ABSD52_01330 [Candidatus Cybelea sp.]